MASALGCLVSGGGSNFEALARAAEEGRITDAVVRLVISNRPQVGALARAEKCGVESLILEPKSFPDRRAYFDRLADEFEKRRVELVCLAGFLLKVEPNFLARFPGRVLNIHPALLPRYGGKGMFGRHVHEAVLKAGDKVSGCTVHRVDENYDQGPILAQVKVPVSAGDTADTLAERVLKEEHRLYPQAVNVYLLSLRQVDA
jgi:phosphoribosylglycinamide formyltransferase-1